MITAAALSVVAAVGWHAWPERTPPVIDREPLAVFPRAFDEWQAGPPRFLERNVERALGADEYLSLSYLSPTEGQVDLFIAYYEDQSTGGIHSPEVCLPGGGWEMAGIRREDISAKIGADAEFNVNRAVIQKGYNRMMVYYWFEQHGRRIAWDFAAKAYLLVDGVLYDRRDGALMRLITPIGPDESDDEAEARLAGFLTKMRPSIDRFSPSAFE